MATCLYQIGSGCSGWYWLLTAWFSAFGNIYTRVTKPIFTRYYLGHGNIPARMYGPEGSGRTLVCSAERVAISTRFLVKENVEQQFPDGGPRTSRVP